MTAAQAQRESLSLDGEWRFVRDRHRLHDASHLPAGEPIHVPGCWEAQVDDPFGIVHAWLWREFELPSSWPSDHDLNLTFGAVMYRSEVWLDDDQLASHEGGYTPFSVRLSESFRRGRHRLAVQVTNPMNAITEYPALSSERLASADAAVADLPISEIPHGKQTWYASQSGIWRGVRVESRPPHRIERLRATANWAARTVELAATTHEGDGAALAVAIHGPDETVVARGGLDVAAGRAAGLVDVPDRLAWEPNAPHLYRVVAQLLIDQTVVDQQELRIGFREIKTSDGRILLNGRPILLRGALDQDLYPGTLATPPSRGVIEEQMRLARAVGLNLLRCHVKVPDPSYLDVADETGMLLWCELPNWMRLTPASAARGKRLLEEMVDLLEAHPSVVIWTIINEDWGTDLRNSAVDRAWLKKAVERLRELDPTRLVVDNSACPAPDGPNFHLDTDLADFHRYAAMPDAAQRWREQMAELTERPAWLWSPHGDARRTGSEPVVLSEFGTWALPDPGILRNAWWAKTGDGPGRPDGIEQRFVEQRLDRVWPDVVALAAGTQRLHFDALRYLVAEIRRHPAMAGFVFTELTDANWEANGLLDLDRRPKLAHRRRSEILGPATLIADLPRRDLWSGERLPLTVTLSADTPGDGGSLHARIGSEHEVLSVGAWAEAGPTRVAELELAFPRVESTTDFELELQLIDDRGSQVATAGLTCAVLPDRLRRTAERLRVAVSEPLGESPISKRVGDIGHELTAPEDADVLVASRLDDVAVRAAEAAVPVLVLARSSDAIPAGILPRPMCVTPRWPSADSPTQPTWSGDWISAWSWILPGLSAGLPHRAPLDFAYAQVLADHVLTGYEPMQDADDVFAGMFVGWVHAPAALIWRQSWSGSAIPIITTTLHLAPESGPVATVLLEALLQLAASRIHQPSPPVRVESRAQ